MSSPQIDPGRRRRLAAHLARARAKPTWDVEEREPKRVVAERFRQALAARDEPELVFRVKRLELATRARHSLLQQEHLQWLESWAAEDPGSLTDALAAFAAMDADATTRFEAWARCDRCALDPDAALAVGSLFNFAMEPAHAPIMSEAAFHPLESELGYEHEADGTLTGRYRLHLHFAALMRQVLADEGIPVEDMLDVQSLIFIAALERDLWAVDPPPDLAAGGGPPPGKYLAICAIYRDEAPYLAEWVEFHKAVGVERFFLYDNRSSDAHMQVLAPYIGEGTVVVHEWPPHPGQIAAYDHCLAEHGTDARWIAFIDVDEFLFSPRMQPLPDVLRAYEQYPAVGVGRATFGTSGHRTSPAGLVIESYLRRGGSNRHVKSIVQPRSAVRCLSAHRFEYRHGLAVDENGYPIHRDATKSVSFERLRINHYYTRSEQELRAKLEAPRADYGQARPGSWELAKDQFNEEHDDLVTAYGPEVRAALEGRRATRSRAT
jgi:hypothetical protein